MQAQLLPIQGRSQAPLVLLLLLLGYLPILRDPLICQALIVKMRTGHRPLDLHITQKIGQAAQALPMAKRPILKTYPLPFAMPTATSGLHPTGTPPNHRQTPLPVLQTPLLITMAALKLRLPGRGWGTAQRLMSVLTYPYLPVWHLTQQLLVMSISAQQP